MNYRMPNKKIRVISSPEEPHKINSAIKVPNRELHTTSTGAVEETGCVIASTKDKSTEEERNPSNETNGCAPQHNFLQPMMEIHQNIDSGTSTPTNIDNSEELGISQNSTE